MQKAEQTQSHSTVVLISILYWKNMSIFIYLGWCSHSCTCVSVNNILQMTISWLELNLILFDLFSYSVFTHLNCQSILQIFVSDKILHRIIELSFVYKFPQTWWATTCHHCPINTCNLTKRKKSRVNFFSAFLEVGGELIADVSSVAALQRTVFLGLWPASIILIWYIHDPYAHGL